MALISQETRMTFSSSRVYDTTLHDAESALYSLNPNCSRDDWVDIAMAFKAAGGSFEAFDDWSSGGDSYQTQSARDTWKSVSAAGPVGPGTLFYRAAAQGWTRESSGRRQACLSPATNTAHPPAAAGNERPTAATLWEGFERATESHPYILKKEGNANGLKVVPKDDSLHIANRSVAGWLVVPCTPLAGGEPVSLLFIAPDGKKLNLPGASLKGVFTVGTRIPGGIVNVCEGIGQAWACWKATGNPSVVCFGAGRMRAVAAELRMHDPLARLVLVPDVGKEADAEAIARDVRAAVARMPEGWPSNSDVNDLGLREGFDVVELLLGDANDPPTVEPRFKLRSGADIYKLPGLTWRIHGILPSTGVAAIFGPSGVGKSLLVLDAAACIAEGGDWFGHRVTPCPVVYVCLEGAGGLRKRIAAWEQHHERPLPEKLHVVVEPVKLTSPRDVEELGRAILAVGSGAVVFIDTLNASAPGIDENSSSGMGSVLEAVKTLQASTDGLVVLVHHTGKDQERGLRGHSSLHAAMDAVIEVGGGKAARHWAVYKAKDEAEGKAYPFTLSVVQLPPDANGDPQSSCVVVAGSDADRAALAIKSVRTASGKNQGVVLDAIRDHFAIDPSATDISASRRCLELEKAIRIGAAKLDCPSDKRTTRAKEAITGLANQGILGTDGQYLWLMQ